MSNPVVPLLIRHGLAGLAAGWIALAALLGFDVAGLRTLILASPDRALAAGMLLAGFGVTFASVAMAAGIMGLARPDPPAPGASRQRRASRSAADPDLP